MTCEEFSNDFDVLVSSYGNSEFGTQNPIAFDEYEKSVFLTKAQEEILLELYSGNITGYEQTEEIRRYLDSLNRISTNNNSTSNTKYLNKYDCLTFSILPEVWFITYEVLTKLSDSKLVIPTTRDSLYITLQNPFKVTKNRCLRVDNNQTVNVYGYDITGYTYEYHYIIKPTPIVLIDLANSNLSIEGVNTVTECAVHKALHRQILERAVALALQSKTIVNNKND